ncbi:hypothetical protein AL532_24795 [Pseudomonas monteilii]|nr:hypothetical protein AL532_24795 [Pseudomonas monteilii]
MRRWITASDSGCLYRPLRGLARSHRDITNIENCGVPVGAGKPAKRPAQVTQNPLSTSNQLVIR